MIKEYGTALFPIFKSEETQKRRNTCQMLFTKKKHKLFLQNFIILWFLFKFLLIVKLVGTHKRRMTYINTHGRIQ